MTVVFVTRYAFVNNLKRKKLNFEIKMSSTHSCIETDWKSETKCRKYSKLHLSHLHFRWNVIFIRDSNFKININKFRLSLRTQSSGSFKLNELVTKSRPTHFFQRNVHISRSFSFVFFWYADLNNICVWCENNEFSWHRRIACIGSNCKNPFITTINAMNYLSVLQVSDGFI